MKKMPKEQQTPFKELSFIQKIQYILTYYGYIFLIVIAVIAVVGSVIYFHFLNNFDSVCNIFAADGKITGYDRKTDKITTGFSEFLGIDGKKQRVVIDYNNSLIVQPMDNEASIAKSKVVIKASVGDIDGFLVSKDFITFFSTDIETFLIDLREMFSANELAKIGEENIVYYTKSNGENIPVAVNLTNTKIKTETDFTMKDPCYGVVVTATNLDNAKAFIKYAFDIN